jgi:hypothetical protein
LIDPAGKNILKGLYGPNSPGTRKKKRVRFGMKKTCLWANTVSAGKEIGLNADNR